MKHHHSKEWNYNWLSKTWIYATIGLLTYYFYTLLRVFIRLGSGLWDNEYSFPYFFLQLAHPAPIPRLNIPGYAWFFIIAISIIAKWLKFKVYTCKLLKIS